MIITSFILASMAALLSVFMVLAVMPEKNDTVKVVVTAFAVSAAAVTFYYILIGVMLFVV